VTCTQSFWRSGRNSNQAWRGCKTHAGIAGIAVNAMLCFRGRGSNAADAFSRFMVFIAHIIYQASLSIALLRAGASLPGGLPWRQTRRALRRGALGRAGRIMIGVSRRFRAVVSALVARATASSTPLRVVVCSLDTSRHVAIITVLS